MELTPDMFGEEVGGALSAFDRHIVCLDKSPDECRASLDSLLQKAIDAYISRGSGLRHGIALDSQVTIILSQMDDQEMPMCGIYFNLHSPYQRQQQPQEK
jgi:hypothetical protein